MNTKDRLKKIVAAVIFLILMTAYVLTTGKDALAAIKAGPKTNPANNHIYYAITSNTWTGAEAEAQSLGGDLVTINDVAENSWVWQTFAPLVGGPLWIGLSDAAHEGTFVWASGEPATYFNWWCRSAIDCEPTNTGGAENYVEMNNYVWNDNTATAQFIGIVEVVDSDGDGLYDSWEKKGIDINSDGLIDLDLPAMGADPKHKDIFVEIDYMNCAPGEVCTGSGGVHSHRPSDAAMTEVKDAFSVAPVSNPDGTNGINLHVDLAEAESITEQFPILFDSQGPSATDDFNDFKLGSNDPSNPGNLCGTGTNDGHFGRVSDRTSSNCKYILEARRLVFRYVIFGHDFTENRGGSGRAELPGNDFFVALGNISPAEYVTLGGQQEVEAATFMHELGHTLGLRHGGSDDINCKPNYPSIMNYAFLYLNILPFRTMTYSSSPGLDIIDLDESFLGLYEPNGIGPGPSVLQTFTSIDENGGGPCLLTSVTCKLKVVAAGGAIDWNNNGIKTDMVFDVDVNRFDTLNCGLDDDGDGILGGLLTSLHVSDDWSNLIYDFRGSPDFADGPTRTTPALILPEPTITQMLTAGQLVHGDTPEVCNGIDDDYNGQIDDGIQPTPTTCGVGACSSTGQIICQNGQPVDTCTPGQSTGGDGNCNSPDGGGVESVGSVSGGSSDGGGGGCSINTAGESIDLGYALFLSIPVWVRLGAVKRKHSKK